MNKQNSPPSPYHLIQNEDSRVLQNGPRNGDPLPLAAGKLYAPLPDDRCKPEAGRQRRGSQSGATKRSRLHHNSQSKVTYQ